MTLPPIQPSSDATSEALHRRLQAYNHAFYGEVREHSFHMEEDGVVVAGVVASSVFDTLEVEYLFVEEAVRGRGYGAALLRRAEESARAYGLRRVLLNTYSFQAPAFYRKQGYREISRIEPCFGAVNQYFFEKML